MTMLTYVYIAGPYRGKTTHDARGYFEIDANINRARKAAATLARLGIPFFCPHLNSAHFEVIAPDVQPAYWLEMDMIFVDLASVLWILEGWEDSQGTLGEIERAKEKKQPVFYPHELSELVAFWEEGS